MILRSSLVAAVFAVACFAFVDPAYAGTIQTIGSGSAIISIDRSVTFDALNFAGRETPLSDYQSGGLYVRTNGNSFYGDDARGTILTVGTPFNPFHLTSASDHSYADVGGGFYFPYEAGPGNYDWVTIQTNDGKKIYGLEFLYGNGWTTGDIRGAYPWGNSAAYLEWKTLTGGAVVSSGKLGIAESLSVGSVVGFRDPNGFDQLMVRAPHPNSVNPNFQELAIDNLNVALSLGAIVPAVGAATLLSPSGSISTSNPSYTWNAIPTATWYQLWLNDANASPKIQQWYTADQAGCSSATGACTVTPATALVPGNYQWWIQARNDAGDGPWSEGMKFTVMAGGIPGKATLISPSGNITTTTPVYTWNAISSATWYQLWVNDSATSPKIKTWYTAAQAECAAGTGTCSVAPTNALALGSGQWWIQTWNDSGYGPWSDEMAFIVGGAGAPGKATLVSPSGSIATSSPAYVWNAVPNATWYQLWVNDSSGNPKIKAWFTAAQTGCASGTGNCSIAATTPLSPGACQWWIQTWNETGYGPWSDGMQFAVTTSGIRNFR